MQFPINLNLVGRKVLVVGAGRIATRKAQQLVPCGADITVIAPHVVAEMRELPVTILEREYAAGDALGFRLVITATGNVEVDQAIYDECEAAGIWVNSADDPDRCSFTLPAVVRRGSLMVTSSTAGASPALSSWIRARLDEMLDDELADLVADLAAERARVHALGESTEDVNWGPIIEELAAKRGIRFGRTLSEVAS
jgi:siroheme synthase-like protein